MTDLSVRRYTDQDSGAVTSIWLESWQSTGVAAPVTLDDLRARWPQELSKGWIVHVAALGAEIIGLVAWHENTLEQLFIAPDYQCQGIGKQLLDFAKAQMPDGFRLHTAAQSRAGRFYEREGLHREGTTTHPKLGHPIVDYAWTPSSE